MSMRTTLSGCTLARIRRTIGSSNEKLVDTIRRRALRHLKEDYGSEAENPAVYREVRDALAVIGGQLKGEPVSRLDDEGIAGYVAAQTLLKRANGTQRPFTPFEVKNAFWLDLLTACKRELGEDEPLFRYLTQGRPLFGRRNSSGLSYAWFDKEEAIRLRDAAQRLADHPRLQRDVDVLTNVNDGFIACIDRLVAAGYDVWADTQ